MSEWRFGDGAKNPFIEGDAHPDRYRPLRIRSNELPMAA